MQFSLAVIEVIYLFLPIPTTKLILSAILNSILINFHPEGRCSPKEPQYTTTNVVVVNIFFNADCTEFVIPMIGRKGPGCSAGELVGVCYAIGVWEFNKKN